MINPALPSIISISKFYKISRLIRFINFYLLNSNDESKGEVH